MKGATTALIQTRKIANFPVVLLGMGHAEHRLLQLPHGATEE